MTVHDATQGASGETISGIESTLETTTRQILEETAFIFADREEDPPDWSGEPLQAEISFAGTSRGLLVLTTSVEFATDLAANMLGLEPDSAEVSDSAPAALTEILNIITGALLENMFGTDTICDLGIPSVHPVTPAEQAARSEQARPSFSLLADEEHRLDLMMFFEDDK